MKTPKKQEKKKVVKKTVSNEILASKIAFILHRMVDALKTPNIFDDGQRTYRLHNDIYDLFEK